MMLEKLALSTKKRGTTWECVLLYKVITLYNRVISVSDHSQFPANLHKLTVENFGRDEALFIIASKTVDEVCTNY